MAGVTAPIFGEDPRLVKVPPEDEDMIALLFQVFSGRGPLSKKKPPIGPKPKIAEMLSEFLGVDGGGVEALPLNPNASAALPWYGQAPPSGRYVPYRTMGSYSTPGPEQPPSEWSKFYRRKQAWFWGQLPLFVAGYPGIPE